MPTTGLDDSSVARRLTPRERPATSIAALDGEGPMWQQIRRVLARPILNGGRMARRHAHPT